MTERSAKSLDELSERDRQHLEAAHERLRRAVADSEPFRGRELQPGVEMEPHDAAAMAAAYAEVDRAEEELWRVREELLGWRRPPAAARAADVADWFSDEDKVYDDLGSEPVTPQR